MNKTDTIVESNYYSSVGNNMNQMQSTMLAGTNQARADELVYASSIDFLNSSQNEKSWLNSSFGDSRNFLNSSLNLPPQLRYTALDEMVKKIVDDDLMASGNSNTLNFAQFASSQQAPNVHYQTQSSTQSQQHQNQPMLYQQQLTQPVQLYTNRSFSRQDSNNRAYLSSFQDESHKLAPTLIQQIDNPQGLNQQNFIFQPNNFYHPYPHPHPHYNYQSPQQQSPTQAPVSSQSNGNFVYPYANEKPIPKFYAANNMTNAPIAERPDTLYPTTLPVPNELLIYPASFSHRLASLNTDQKNYLLEQQKELVRAIESNESQLNSPIKYIPVNNVQYNPILAMSKHPYQPHGAVGGAFLNPTFIGVLTPNSPMTNMPTPTMHNKPADNMAVDYLKLTSHSSSSSVSSTHSINSTIKTFESENLPNNSNKSSLNGMNPNISIPLIHLTSNLGNENFMLNEFKPNIMPDLHSNDAFRMMMKQQTFRTHRRTGPSNKLHIYLEECLNQIKSISTERKKIESELFQTTVSRKFSPSTLSSGQGQSANIARLPSNPSRVDRLIVDCFKEQVKVETLLHRMDSLKNTIFFDNILKVIKQWLEKIYVVQARRKDEIVNCANNARLAQASSVRAYDDKDVGLLADSINELAQAVANARTYLWCAMHIANANYKQPESVFIERPNYSISGEDKSHVGQQQDADDSSLFDTHEKTQDFLRKKIQIKTDLI